MRAPLADSIHLTPHGDLPLYRQLYQQVRDLIMEGKLVAGSELPSSRQFASALGIGRNTVLTVYDQLIAEGYLVARRGAGTRVAALKLPVGRGRRPGGAVAPRLSARGRSLNGAGGLRELNGGIAFAVGFLPVDTFPRSTWNRILAKHARNTDLNRFTLTENWTAGSPRLREAIASYLGVSRGVSCEKDNVFIVPSAQAAFDLCARLLADAGDAVWFEEPGYSGARSAFEANGLDLVPIPVDESGLVVEVGQRKAPAARMAYVSPSHQFPTGVTLSLQRRVELLDWAARSDAWIIEDDYDSEYRFSGKPIAAVQGLDENHRVIYVGTFSKTMLPSVKVAYLVVPDPAVPVFRRALAPLGYYAAPMLQAALADFITEGHFFANLKRARAVALERRSQLAGILNEQCQGLNIIVPDGGLTLPVWFDYADEEKLAADCRQVGLTVRFASQYYLSAPHRDGLILGCAGVGGQELTSAGKRLAAIIQRHAV